VSSGTTGLQGKLATVWSDLQSLAGNGYLTTSGLTTAGLNKLSSLDLCELTQQTMPNPSTFTSFATGLTGSNGTGGVYADLSGTSPGAEFESNLAAGFSLLTPPSTVTTGDATVQADNSGITAAVSSSGALNSSTTASIQSGLTTLINCVFSSSNSCLITPHVKRISVAVVLDSTRKGVGPSDAVWMSSVVSDPTDGLL
jgi:hypothetical protein